jgi:hypothetical protein
MIDRMVTLETYTDSFRAEAARARLEEAGIPVLLQDENTVSAFWGLGASFATVKLEVPQDEVERARQILATPPERSTDITAEPPDEEEPEVAPESAEGLAVRAWRAALFGTCTLIVLLHLYSLWLVFRTACSDEELSPAGTRRMYGALVIDGIVLVAFAVVVRALGGF